MSDYVTIVQHSIIHC